MNCRRAASAFLVAVLMAGVCFAESGTVGGSAISDEEAAYRDVIAGRAKKIVDPLQVADAAVAERARELVADFYFGLRDIHDSRDAAIEKAKSSGGDVEAVRRDAQIEQFRLHRNFVSRLSVVLSPEQVEGVKDGLTYGVVPATYAQYLRLLPEMKPEEKAAVKAWLVEAREYAMDGGSSEEKHGVFRNYKGKIGNYLSNAGYDLKEAERRLTK